MEDDQAGFKAHAAKVGDAGVKLALLFDGQGARGVVEQRAGREEEQGEE